MTTKQELLDLAERVEGCEQIDAEIAAILHVGPKDAPEWVGKNFDTYVARDDGTVAVLIGTGEHGVHWTPPRFTTSLDAAKALHDAVLPGWDYCIRTMRVQVWRYNGPDVPSIWYNGNSDNPPTAWVAAILRAKAEECEE